MDNLLSMSSIVFYLVLLIFRLAIVHSNSVAC